MEVGSVQVITVCGVLLGLLLSGNIFFVKRLIDRVDKSADIQEKQSGKISMISEGMNTLGIQLRDLKLDVKDLRRVEIEVAVLKAQYNRASAENPSLS